jgi:hypothetical protein
METNQSPTWSDTFSQSLGEAQHALRELGHTLDPVRTTFEQAISDHPVKAGVLSLALGVLLGWLIKR